MTKESIWRGFWWFVLLTMRIEFVILGAGLLMSLLYLLAFIDVHWWVLATPMITVIIASVVKLILFAIMLVLLPLLPLKDE